MSAPLLKHSVGENAVQRIACALQQTGHAFVVADFQQQCIDGLEPLALKQRVSHIIAVLNRHLPPDFPAAAQILYALKQYWDEGDPDDSNRAMAAWPVIDYVAVYGMDHPAVALPLLKHLTPLFSAEFAIQPFILQHFDLAYRHILKWCHDEDAHVRRLACEGMRPQLPWGIRMKQFCRDPAPILPVLEKLKHDPSPYVRKSVANNLNDISKHHPDQVLSLCRNWTKKPTPASQWIIRHGTRTLVKQGHPEVFPLLGYPAKPTVTVSQLRLATENPAIGDTLEVDITLHNHGKKAQAIVLDYALHYLTASGKTSRKVFKLATPTLQAGETLTVSKSLSFKPLSTRCYYPGEHAISILVNGREKARSAFELVRRSANKK